MNEGSSPRRRGAMLGWISVVLVVILTLWAYSPSLDAGFVFDDQPNIVDSPAVRWDEVSWENLDLILNASLLQGRPVANISFAIDHLVWGLDASKFHLTNILIHLAVGGALLWICLLYARFALQGPQSQTGQRSTLILGLVCVGVFLIHPLNTQAITYVVQRMASLAALFSLLAFASYLMARYRVTSRSGWWYMAAALFLLLGLGSKENAILLLPVIALYEACFFRREWQRRVEKALDGHWNRQWTIRAWIVAFVLFVFAGWVVTVSSGTVSWLSTFGARDYNGLERVFTQTRVQIFYLSLLLWPSPARLSLDHDFSVSRGLLDPATTLFATSACAVLLVTAIFLCVRRPRYGFPIFAYIVFHAIEAGPVSLDLIFEHRMYLPSTMLVLLGTALLVDAKPRAQLVALAAILVLYIPLAHSTYARNQVWVDPLTLQADIARKSPNKARAQHNFALALRDAGRIEEALAVVQQAIKLDPTDDRPRALLGDVLLDLDRSQDALQTFRIALDLNPNSMAPILGIGRALIADGREEDAFMHYLQQGTQFGQGGSPWQAIPVLEEAVLLRPDDAEARHALGSAYLMYPNYDNAIEQFRAALQLDPAKYESWYNLGLTADALSLHDEAMRAYKGFIEFATNRGTQRR
jgi:tetratricopeptide (TPR) repeat protein